MINGSDLLSSRFLLPPPPVSHGDGGMGDDRHVVLVRRDPWIVAHFCIVLLLSMFLRFVSQGIRRLGSEVKNAYPETPLHYYKAENAAIQSINHRMFYVNWILVLFIWDVATAMVDF